MTVRLSGLPGSFAQRETGLFGSASMMVKGDKRFVFTAARHAQRAADYLHALQPGQQADAEQERAGYRPPLAGGAVTSARRAYSVAAPR